MSNAFRSNVSASPLAALATLLVVAVAFAGCAGGPVEGVLRLGYFPNLTHAQPLYGVTTGLYQETLGETKLETTTFNAGPPAFEALLARHIDVIYVGPSPTINAIERTGVSVVVIVAGSASGGAMFVVKPDLTLESGADFSGKKFATPQLGNTQDVALKHYMLEKGAKPTDKGGDVQVINAANADILALFQQNQIDGAWVPEPWATRLVKEGGGEVEVDEAKLWTDGKFVTTHLVTTREFATHRKADLEKLVAAHHEATQMVSTGSDEVLRAINDGIKAATGKPLAEDTLKAAFKNVDFTTDDLRATFHEQYAMAHDVGFAKQPPSDLDRVYEVDIMRPTVPSETG